MKFVLLVCAAAALGSCASAPSVTAFQSPDGRPAFAIDCSDTGLSSCYTTARESCGGNYEIMRTVDGSVPITNPVTGQLVSLNDQRMYVSCETKP